MTTKPGVDHDVEWYPVTLENLEDSAVEDDQAERAMTDEPAEVKIKKIELDDRNGQRWLLVWLAPVVGGFLLGIVALLLHYNQAATLIDLAQVAGGFGGGLFVGQILLRRGG